MRIAPSTIVARTSGCLAAEMGDELVLMSTEHGLYLSLDAIGKNIWSHLDPPCAFATLCDRLSAEYAAPRATIETDVTAMLHTLRDAGAVEMRA
ncbi:PqqD family protein [Xanthomonas cissicola]|nr:PqqD family protein [Xanthomonas cissicola]